MAWVAAVLAVALPSALAQQIGARCAQDSDCAVMQCQAGEIPVCSRMATSHGEAMECECGTVAGGAPPKGTFDPRTECGGSTKWCPGTSFCVPKFAQCPLNSGGSGPITVRARVRVALFLPRAFPHTNRTPLPVSFSSWLPLSLSLSPSLSLLPPSVSSGAWSHLLDCCRVYDLRGQLRVLRRRRELLADAADACGAPVLRQWAAHRGRVLQLSRRAGSCGPAVGNRPELSAGRVRRPGPRRHLPAVPCGNFSATRRGVELHRMSCRQVHGGCGSTGASARSGVCVCVCVKRTTKTTALAV